MKSKKITKYKIICDICDKEVPAAIKEDNVWVCKVCSNRFPNKKHKENHG